MRSLFLLAVPQWIPVLWAVATLLDRTMRLYGQHLVGTQAAYGLMGKRWFCGGRVDSFADHRLRIVGVYDQLWQYHNLCNTFACAVGPSASCGEGQPNNI